jgi:hypothetical protein
VVQAPGFFAASEEGDSSRAGVDSSQAGSFPARARPLSWSNSTSPVKALWRGSSS